jgi:MarR family transcriptional regulator, transcriptional regulator for hemolysin
MIMQPGQHSFITDKDDSNESLLIHDIARLLKKNFDRRVKDFGLTRAQWLTVGVIRRNPGISQADLADRLDIQPITAARTIDRLEKAGWIERRLDAGDRRIKRLYLTGRVQEVVGQMRAVGLELRTQAVDGLSGKDHEMLVRLLRKMKDNLCNMKPGSCSKE